MRTPTSPRDEPIVTDLLGPERVILLSEGWSADDTCASHQSRRDTASFIWRYLSSDPVAGRCLAPPWRIVHTVSRRVDVARGLVQLVAAVMAITNTAAWMLASRWERPESDVELRARLHPPPIIGWGGDLAQVVPLVYPVLVVVAPAWAYQGWLNWSTGIDLALQAVGLGFWALGIAVGLWAGRVIGEYMAVSGVTVDHRLVTDGPYRYVRHPVYTSVTAYSVGTALMFRSYLLVGVAAIVIVTHLWWATSEEKLLSSPEGFGDRYRTYASQTGRFLPRVRRARRSTGSV